MFNSKGMTHLGFALEKKTKGSVMVMTTTANPLCSLLFLSSNLAALHHTRRHHHEQRGEAMEIGKNGKRKSNRFLKRNGGDRRWRALIFLLFSSLPLPLPSLLLMTAQGVAAQGGAPV